MQALNFRHRVHDFSNAAGVEQIFVEVMGVTMVAQIETKYMVAGAMQGTRRRQHVVGLGAAFPTVQQDHQIRRCVGMGIETPQQTRTVRGCYQLGASPSDDPPAAPRDHALTRRTAGDDGLDMTVAQNRRRHKRAGCLPAWCCAYHDVTRLFGQQCDFNPVVEIGHLIPLPGTQARRQRRIVRGGPIRAVGCDNHGQAIV